MARILIGNTRYRPAVGMHHIQFSGEPTPAEIFPNTSWEIDTDYAGRTIIGSGGEYTFGETGGSLTHTLTEPELPEHNHAGLLWGVNTISFDNGSGEGFYLSQSWSDSLGISKFITGTTGAGIPFNIEPPYRVVNIWKRIS